MSAGNSIKCPICGKMFNSSVIAEHANSCLNSKETNCNNELPSVSSGVKRKSTDWDFFSKKKPTLPKNYFESHANSSTKINKSELKKQANQMWDSKPKMLRENGNSDIIDVDSNIIDVGNVSKVKGPALKCENQKFSGLKRPKVKPLDAPLSDKVRPQCFEDYVGQTRAVGKNSLLHSLLMKGSSIPSMILWGPPGCGKTTLAKILAHKCQRGGNTKFVSLSATSATVKDVKDVATVAQNDQKMLRKKTVLFLDEIHRFNKLQQDALLPYVENGIVTLIGATTENPSFHINSALLSRCRVVTLDKLQIEDVKMIVERACHKMGVHIRRSQEDVSCVNNSQGKETEDYGDGHYEQEFTLDCDQTENVQIDIEENAVDALAGLVDGDARAALNGLHITVQARLMEERQHKERDEENGVTAVVVTLDNIKEGLQRSHVLYDRNGEEHFNIASAMIKSMRGSNDSAALYWMARMLEGGENPLFVARRLVVFASEDVGLADHTALSLAVSTYQACQLIGMPECAINLAHCAVYLSRAPKSVESHTGYHHAKLCVKNHQGPLPSVPLHLRNAPTKLMKKMGYGDGYKYPPAFEGEVNQEYFPTALAGTDFFAFTKEQRPRDKTVTADVEDSTNGFKQF